MSPSKPRQFRIAPSILSADFVRLGDEVKNVIAVDADSTSFHADAGPQVHRRVQAIKSRGCKAGQRFIDSALRKIEAVRRCIDACGRVIRLEVDGGIEEDNIARVAAAGADTFVAGSAIFGKPDYRAAIAAMRPNLARA